jgi:hypothetical protein
MMGVQNKDERMMMGGEVDSHRTGRVVLGRAIHGWRCSCVEGVSAYLVIIFCRKLGVDRLQVGWLGLL